MPGIRTQAAIVSDFFELLHPHSMDFQFANISKFINTPFVLKTKADKMMSNWGKKPMIILKGKWLQITQYLNSWAR